MWIAIIALGLADLLATGDLLILRQQRIKSSKVFFALLALFVTGALVFSIGITMVFIQGTGSTPLTEGGGLWLLRWLQLF